MISGHRNQQGLTLLEACIALSLFLFSSGAALAGWKFFIQHQTQHQVETRLLHTLQAARHLAMFNADLFTVCGSRDQLYCDGDWKAGWILKNSHNEIILSFSLKHSLPVSFHGYPNSEALSFESTGLPLGNGHFRVGQRCIIINAGGRIRTESCA